MISALAIYLDGNDAGSGFFNLALDRASFRVALSSCVKEQFWISQVKALHVSYQNATSEGAGRR